MFCQFPDNFIASERSRWTTPVASQYSANNFSATNIGDKYRR
jgi:hypothetical protein